MSVLEPDDPPPTEEALLATAVALAASVRPRAGWGHRVRVLCASDIAKACSALQEQLGLEHFAVYASGGKKLSADKEGETDYLVDVGLLCDAAVFFGTGSSNLSRFVNALRGPAKLSLSLDVDFNAIYF